MMRVASFPQLVNKVPLKGRWMVDGDGRRAQEVEAESKESRDQRAESRE
jgi:hypothetical protein